jgi:hypothetical protein
MGVGGDFWMEWYRVLGEGQVFLGEGWFGEGRLNRGNYGVMVGKDLMYLWGCKA